MPQIGVKAKDVRGGDRFDDESVMVSVVGRPTLQNDGMVRIELDCGPTMIRPPDAQMWVYREDWKLHMGGKILATEKVFPSSSAPVRVSNTSRVFLEDAADAQARLAELLARGGEITERAPRRLIVEFTHPSGSYRERVEFTGRPRSLRRLSSSATATIRQ